MAKQLDTQHFKPSKEDSALILKLKSKLGVNFAALVRMGLRHLLEVKNGK